jgi:homoserine kinase type II
MTIVFRLTHAYEQDNCEEVKLIGIYTSKELALAALDRVKDKPGFKERPEGFEIDEVVLDTDDWTEGFISWAEALSSNADKTK